MSSKIVVVTGGTRGIGKEIVINYLKNNHTVFYIYKSKSLKNLEFKKFKNKLFGFKLNLENPNEIDKFFKFIKKKVKKIDILVNNAGDVLKRINFSKTNLKFWNRSINLNLISPIILTNKLLPLILKSSKPVIINISSIASKSGGAPDSIHYGVSKAGLNGFTKGISTINKKLRVVGVAPSIIDTDFQKKHSNKKRIKKIIQETPIGRIGTTKDVSNLVFFLTSDNAAYISGETIFITGGR